MVEDITTLTLLRTLHSIAARRGDGLRQELLEMITPSQARSDFDKVADVGNADEENERASEWHDGGVPTAEIVRLPRYRG